jgi:hypothetical protein
MKMRFASALLAVLIMCFMAFPGLAYLPADETVTAEVFSHIQEGVNAGQTENSKNSDDLKEYDKLVAIVDAANLKIEKCVETAIRSEKDDVEKLLEKVDNIVAYVMNKADAAGYEVECIYEPYEIDGQTVLIDPLRVVNSR